MSKSPSQSPDAKPKPAQPAAKPAGEGPWFIVREWIDALVIAFVLAMFIKIFLVELYRIPTGSMTPTLIGGEVASVDYNGDGRKDLLLYRGQGYAPLLFLNDGRRLVAQGPMDIRTLPTDSFHQQFDRILVNKFAYWFGPPSRGDIIVFKVPEAIWKSHQPIYIKRCVGQPDDTLAFDSEGHLLANGERVTAPGFFRTQRYINVLDFDRQVILQDNVTYKPLNSHRIALEQIRVPTDKVYAFGDNTHSSLDSRYWGGVPLVNLKGRAFFRYWPLGQMKFLRDN